MVQKEDVCFQTVDITLREAIDEAKRCLKCPRPSCKAGCPIENDIPEFIHELSKGNLGEAREIIARKSNLPAVCGRVCPHEKQCQGHCVLGKKGEAVRIGALERFIADFDAEMDLLHSHVAPKIRGKVAIIGSGPAGLTVAGDLAKEGFHVVVFESESEPGGVLLYGIPEFRLPKKVVRREVARIASLGVTFFNNVIVGPNLTVDEMFGQGFDAVFIGTGTALAQDLSLPGRDLAGVLQAVYLLRMITLYNNRSVDRSEVPVRSGDRVLVIGGGNVAMDAARSALRMGAGSVAVVYRKTADEMPALKSEYDGALGEGVVFHWQSAPLSFQGEEGVVTGLMVETPEGERLLAADKILIAVGSRPASRIVSSTEGIQVDSKGYVVTKERPYGMSTLQGVFAGGDVVHQPATVVLAMKEAKKVALGIAAYVDAKKLLGQ